MKKIDRLIMLAKKQRGSSGVIVAFMEKIAPRKWSVTGRMSNGDFVYNKNALKSKKQAEECVDALIEHHNQYSDTSCIVFTGEEELED